ncbi:hypothetical protein HMPREF0972_02460 [Actinomyces sp. oral taxon 848 str. F0332]|nr:hypothetical protein HMPREF0972_02460 [Actinomyces sp. oral taxon 848 str. F0332]
MPSTERKLGAACGKATQPWRVRKCFGGDGHRRRSTSFSSPAN